MEIVVLLVQLLFMRIQAPLNRNYQVEDLWLSFGEMGPISSSEIYFK